MSEYTDNQFEQGEPSVPEASSLCPPQAAVQDPPAPKPKKGWTALRITALALCCAILGGAMGAGITLLGNSLTAQSSDAVPAGAPTSTVMKGVRETSVIDIQTIDTSAELTAAEVYAANVNSTVGITTSITTNFWGYQTSSAASGSGFILTDDGYVLTNYHVIESSNSITVTTYSGDSYDASLIGYDESNDIAVLKIDANGLTPVVLGSSDSLNVGDSVVAIGNPLGELTFSLTAGAISALSREITLSNGVTMDLIQTDCAINSGNSGGALFNMHGEVIGITNAKYSSSGSEASIDNIGFAIPIGDISGIVKSIIEKGYYAKSYIGVSVADVSEEMQSYGLPKGAAVKLVAEGSPAAEAGLQVNDIITEVGNTQITGSSDLADQISAATPGDLLELTIYRQGETLTLEISVGEQIQSALQQEETSQNSQTSQSRQPWGYGFRP